jgi:hypothetical protein
MRFGADSRIDIVARGYERALGTRIIAIQDTPLASGQKLAATATPVAETAGLRDRRVDAHLTIGMMLHGLGITPSRNSPRYLLLDDDGKEFTVDFKALALRRFSRFGAAQAGTPNRETASRHQGMAAA